MLRKPLLLSVMLMLAWGLCAQVNSPFKNSILRANDNKTRVNYLGFNLIPALKWGLGDEAATGEPAITYAKYLTPQHIVRARASYLQDDVAPVSIIPKVIDLGYLQQTDYSNTDIFRLQLGYQHRFGNRPAAIVIGADLLSGYRITNTYTNTERYLFDTVNYNDPSIFCETCYKEDPNYDNFLNTKTTGIQLGLSPNVGLNVMVGRRLSFSFALAIDAYYEIVSSESIDENGTVTTMNDGNIVFEGSPIIGDITANFHW